jgi:hypothetical protein
LNVVAGHVVTERNVFVLFSGELDIPNAVVFKLWVREARPGLSREIYFSSCYKFEGNNFVLNIFNILQHLFSWNVITNILYSKLCTGTYVSLREYILTVITYFVNMVRTSKYFSYIILFELVLN